MTSSIAGHLSRVRTVARQTGQLQRLAGSAPRRTSTTTASRGSSPDSTTTASARYSVGVTSVHSGRGQPRLAVVRDRDAQHLRQQLGREMRTIVEHVDERFVFVSGHGGDLKAAPIPAHGVADVFVKPATVHARQGGDKSPFIVLGEFPGMPDDSALFIVKRPGGTVVLRDGDGLARPRRGEQDDPAGHRQGVLPATAGTVTFEGREVTRLKPEIRTWPWERDNPPDVTC